MALGLGVLAIVFLTNLWLTGATADVIALWSGVALAYFVAFAPTECLAQASDGGVCRRQKRGLVRACDVRSHRWENLLHFVTPPPDVRDFLGRTWTTMRAPSTFVAAVGTVVALGSALVAQIIQSV